jgi:hypothetical protein
MTDLEKALDHIAQNIKSYRELKPDDGNGMVECLQQITPTLYYLEGERAKAHEKYQGIIQRLILDGNSVSRAENEAHVQVPEMYMLRKLIDSAYTTTEAIRSHLSWIKQGLNGQ